MSDTIEKFAVLRQRINDEEEKLILHLDGFNTKAEAIHHARFHKIQYQYPNHRWFVIPMEEVEIP